MKEYSELRNKNNNAKYIDGANWILVTLPTRSLLPADVAYHKSCYQAFRSKGRKKKSQKDEKQNFADSDEAAWNDFCQIVKIHIVIRGEVYSATVLTKVRNELKRPKTI